MKKTSIILFALLGVCIQAFAQSMYDGYTFSENNYFGSAKSVGLSNAVTAIGGDLGTIGINPAGSAVAGYSQFMVSPGLSLSLGRTHYSLTPDSDPGLGQNSLSPRFKLPNIGISARYETERGSSLKAFVFAMTVNTTNDFNYKMVSRGANPASSRFAEMAAAATDLNISPSDLSSNSFYDNSAYSNYWDTALGYDIGLINSYGTDNRYVGCSEVLNDRGEHYVPSALGQTSTVTHIGYKTDIILNFGFNFSDRLFLGFNLGIPNLEYTNVENFAEVAQTVEDFPVSFNYSDGTTEDTYFSDAAYRYNYYAKATGVYAKFGLIWLPTNSLRLGLAYQTRTTLTVEESWQHSGMVRYDNGNSYSGSGEDGWFRYNLYTPSVIDAGLAWTFGRRGLVSFDYELTNYGRMQFESDEAFETDYALENEAARSFSGLSHAFRLGAEVNLTHSLALRAGGSFRTSPEKYYTDLSGAEVSYSDFDNDYFLGRKQLPLSSSHYADFVYGGSLGLGYNPAGSFFADFAVQGTVFPATNYQPYYDYADLFSPRIRSRRALLGAVLTLGWRF